MLARCLEWTKNLCKVQNLQRAWKEPTACLPFGVLVRENTTLHCSAQHTHWQCKFHVTKQALYVYVPQHKDEHEFSEKGQLSENSSTQHVRFSDLWTRTEWIWNKTQRDMYSSIESPFKVLVRDYINNCWNTYAWELEHAKVSSRLQTALQDVLRFIAMVSEFHPNPIPCDIHTSASRDSACETLPRADVPEIVYIGSWTLDDFW